MSDAPREQQAGRADAQPAILVAGTRSGCGKTTLTLAIMAAFGARGMQVRPFKCGPDFIDPTLHLQVTGQVSRNLDVRMCGEDFVRHCFGGQKAGGDISVIEGVMGLFDGGRGSAARLAALLDIPVLLVVDVRSAAESVAAVVRGFESLNREVRVEGVILNRVGSERHVQLIEKAVRQHCRAVIVGAMPRETHISMPSRHLGLHLGPEMPLDLERLARLAEAHLDLDRILELARMREPLPAPHQTAPARPATPVRLGLAWDEAFCFYYQDNLDMLRHAGAELVLFSPMHENRLPDNLDGLYLGGGYPELHAARLAANRAMRGEVREFALSGRPVYAECGGFMYLCAGIVDQKGEPHAMAGVFPVQAQMAKRLRRLGYRRLELRRDSLLGPAGGYCYGHEFHYSEISRMPREIERVFRLDDGRGEGYRLPRTNTMAGYVHLHWGRTPEVAGHFVDMMRTVRRQNT